MAGIDKTYVSNWNDWKEVCDWMKAFSRKLPNNSVVKGRSFLYYPDATQKEIEDWIKEQGNVPVMNTSHTMDYFLIKECPIELVQQRMQAVYDDETYNTIKNGTSEYDTFVRPEGGKHVKLVTKPKYYKPFRVRKEDGTLYQDHYVVDDITLPGGDYSWYYEDIDYWSMPYELIAGGFSSAADVYCKTFKALIRKILKWKLPVGTKVSVSHFRFQGGNCELIITK